MFVDWCGFAVLVASEGEVVKITDRCQGGGGRGRLRFVVADGLAWSLVDGGVGTGRWLILHKLS